jgi:nucleotide-binding universal stress UspA family protein
VSETIVLGYDGSPSANAALAETIQLAPLLGARVVAVFGYYISPLGGLQEGSVREALEQVAAHELARAVADLQAAGIDAESRMGHGKPADVLIAVAKDVGAKMIVVGTEGEGAITGTILGSVVLKLLQRSPVALHVVPTSS